MELSRSAMYTKTSGVVWTSWRIPGRSVVDILCQMEKKRR